MEFSKKKYSRIFSSFEQKTTFLAGIAFHYLSGVLLSS